MAHAFHLLVQLIYFGDREIEECLRVLFQEKLVYPFVQSCKKRGVESRAIKTALLDHLLGSVRFIGVGAPSESGTSFLYPFRKANGLPDEIFSNLDKAVTFRLESDKEEPTIVLDPPTLTEIIYIDDFCATGQQVEHREGANIQKIRKAKPTIKINYFILFATSDALKHLRALPLFNRVEAAIIFDDDYKVFSTKSHFYRTPHTDITQDQGKAIMTHYGRLVEPDPANVLGYHGSQMLVSFKHNTPDNTLPVIWKKKQSVPWHPIFQRVEKVIV